MKISVIIPAFNAGATLERALNSVWFQSHSDFEVIVMDGGSKDSTRSLLESNSKKIAYWVSEKDEGTTDAMNKGFQKATGDVVTFLCADDQFHDAQVFARVAEEFGKFPQTGVLCGSLRTFDPEGLVRPFVSRPRPELLHWHMTAHLPGSFFRREVLKDRQFDQSAEVANDYELFAYLQQVKKPVMRVLDDVVVTFSLGGRTNDPVTDFWKARECFQIRRKYYGEWAAWPRYLLDLTVSTLRWMHFRPLTWARKTRRWLIGSSAA